MLARIRPRLTFANVVSVIALFVALGGSATAALLVTGRNVKNSSLTGADIRNSSLGTQDIRNGTLLARDFKAGQLPIGATGPQGIPGPSGAGGAAGPAGRDGAAVILHAAGTDDLTVPAGESRTYELAPNKFTQTGTEAVIVYGRIRWGNPEGCTGDDPNPSEATVRFNGDEGELHSLLFPGTPAGFAFGTLNFRQIPSQLSFSFRPPPHTSAAEFTTSVLVTNRCTNAITVDSADVFVAVLR